MACHRAKFFSGECFLVREMIIGGCSPEDIKSMWKDDVERFKSLRRKYLLYNE